MSSETGIGSVVVGLGASIILGIAGGVVGYKSPLPGGTLLGVTSGMVVGGVGGFYAVKATQK